MATLRLTASKAHLEAVHAFLEESVPEAFAAMLGKVQLAAEELFVNTYLHAYPPDSQGQVVIDCEHLTVNGLPCLRLRVTDWAPPFDPFTEAPAPDLVSPLMERPAGGLGIHLIRSLSCRQHYARSQGANVIELDFSPTGRHAP